MLHYVLTDDAWKLVRLGFGIIIVVMIFAPLVVSFFNPPSPPDFVPPPPGGIEGDVSSRGFPYMEPLDPYTVKRDLAAVNSTEMSFNLEDFRPEDREKMLEDFEDAGFNVTVEGGMVTAELKPRAEATDYIEKGQARFPSKTIEPRYLPANFSYGGSGVHGGKAMLEYEDPMGRRIAILEWEVDEYEHRPYPGEEEVMINGTKGFFSTPGPYNLVWRCDNLVISLTADLSGGREAVKSAMIKIAESMEC
jgi:hypothetical protein